MPCWEGRIVTKKCTDLIQGLNDYLDGEIASELCAEIEKHLGDCHDCRLMVDTLKMTVKLCRESGQCEELPPEFAAKLNDLLRRRWEQKFRK